MANMSPGVNHPNTSRCAGGSVRCCTIYIYTLYTRYLHAPAFV